MLRGAPHWVKGPADAAWRREDRWQFTKERWFAQQLHQHTRAPVPWPMLHDETGDIFGWPYLVMPRMPGTCFDERGIMQALPAAQRHDVAVALGENLAEMQRLTSPFAGARTVVPTGTNAHEPTRMLGTSAALSQATNGRAAPLPTVA